jgi:AcrR family transcriptional regulator
VFSTTADWRETRREAARTAILQAAWEMVDDAGLAALSLRDLAHRAGASVPTIYKYFASKNDIYDAMFGQAATEFEQRLATPPDSGDPPLVLREGLQRFLAFCAENSARYQLLFQRTVPGFEPSSDSYAPAVRALDGVRARLALNGITDPQHVDLWTALATGLVDQQISNDPGGDRWSRLTDEAVAMFLAHCHAATNQKRRGRP